MTRFRFIRTVAGIACVLGTVVTACTSTVSGSPSPAPVVPPISRPGSSDVFAGLDACRLLDQLNAGQGFNPGENKSRRNQCTASKLDFATYSIALDATQGLREFAATNTGVREISVHARKAMEADISTGGCAVAVEVADRALALVLVTMARGSEDAQGCPNARSFAEKLEPLLPPVS
ncbi:DUF3558 family protein [Amycolatopsis granulosa]|uniref:DUF3558 family protein n=1 Tax=Amycolatopsis granulosa TaxID=185684 RepID=UPI00312C9734|nr:hypothetical protein [Amycolatopsis granulosa]